MTGLIEQLGKTPDQVQEDLRLVQRVRALKQTAEAGRGAEERAARAREATRAYDAETARVIQERRAGDAALYAEQRRAEQAQVDASGAGSELARLMRAQPGLLAAASGE